MAQAKKTATYRVVTDAGGRSFRFYCDLSGELCCVTKPLRADTEQAALALAWETEGRWHFNRCPACGRANRAQDTHCTDCGAALPEKTLYDLYRARHRCCLSCGVVVTDVAVYCPECGTRLPKAARRRGAAG